MVKFTLLFGDGLLEEDAVGRHFGRTAVIAHSQVLYFLSPHFQLRVILSFPYRPHLYCGIIEQIFAWGLIGGDIFGGDIFFGDVGQLWFSIFFAHSCVDLHSHSFVVGLSEIVWPVLSRLERLLTLLCQFACHFETLYDVALTNVTRTVVALNWIIFCMICRAKDAICDEMVIAVSHCMAPVQQQLPENVAEQVHRKPSPEIWMKKGKVGVE